MKLRKITLFIVDSDLEAIDALASAARQTPDLTVVGKATSGQTALSAIRELRPDVAVVSLDLPDSDTMVLINDLSGALGVNVLATSATVNRERIEHAREAGARDFLASPFLPREVAEAIRGVVPMPAAAGAAATPVAPPPARGKVVTVFGTKGGVGKTTVAVNLAAALNTLTHGRVVLVDLDLEFGSAAAMLGTKPLATIVDLWRSRNDLTQETAERSLLSVTGNGLRLLASPPTPDLAAELESQVRPGQGNGLTEILKFLARSHDWVVVDTSSSFREVNLTALDLSDQICVITAPDIPTLRNTGKCLDILLDQLAFDPTKIRLVLNHSDASVGLTNLDVSSSLGTAISNRIPHDNSTAAWAANCGQPFVIHRPATPIAKAVSAIAKTIIDSTAGDSGSAKKQSWFSRSQTRRREGA